MDELEIFLGLLAALNLLTFATWWRDKDAARKRERRVPEARLLTLAAIGGWPAAKLGQRIFRHKTRKQPFARRLNLVPLAWLCLAGLIYWLA